MEVTFEVLEGTARIVGQTLTEIGAEKNTTVVFPLPIDLIAGLFSRGNGTAPAPIASTSDEVALG